MLEVDRHDPDVVDTEALRTLLTSATANLESQVEERGSRPSESDPIHGGARQGTMLAGAPDRPVDEPIVDADVRAGQYAVHADLGWVASVLVDRRDAILDQWLAAARTQPFHAGTPDRAVADHIPPLFDGIVAVLQRSTPRWIEPGSPLDDPVVLHAARGHARMRFAQGLEAVDIVTEFRLLRQEIGRALRVHLADAAPASDSLAAELLVHDALDGAITLALEALTRHIEEVRQDFLATTMHDVQQPLSVVKGRVQLALRQLRQPQPDAAAVAAGLQSVLEETDRLTRMLGSLADASRLGLGAFELRRSSVDIVELLWAAIRRMPEGTAERVQLRVEAEPIVGFWDRELLERVIDNVLSNAAKYSPPDSAIDVSVDLRGETALLAVHDHGIGLSETELEHVFERYRRAQGAVELGIRGQGLGLYVARGVVEAHGGRMWLESPGPGFGATVFVRLPRQTDA